MRLAFPRCRPVCSSNWCPTEAHDRPRHISMWQGSGSVGWDRDGDGDEDDGDLGGDLRKPIEVLVGTGM